MTAKSENLWWPGMSASAVDLEMYVAVWECKKGAEMRAVYALAACLRGVVCCSLGPRRWWCDAKTRIASRAPCDSK